MLQALGFIGKGFRVWGFGFEGFGVGFRIRGYGLNAHGLGLGFGLWV